MTSPLPKKRPTTARGGNRAIPTACSLALLLASAAGAQQPRPVATPYIPTSMANTQQQPPANVAEPLPLGGVRPPEPWEQPAPYTILLEPPSIYRVAISVESDAQLQERI